MIIMFYNNSDVEEVVNKTPIQLSAPVQCRLKNNVRWDMPVITLQNNIPDFNGVNYCQIADGPKYSEGYYFIRDHITQPGGVIDIVLEKDVLYTNAQRVLTGSSGRVTSSTKGNPYVENGSFVTEVREEIQQLDFPEGFDDQGQFILIVSGGGAFYD